MGWVRHAQGYGWSSMEASTHFHSHCCEAGWGPGKVPATGGLGGRWQVGDMYAHIPRYFTVHSTITKSIRGQFAQIKKSYFCKKKILFQKTTKGQADFEFIFTRLN